MPDKIRETVKLEVTPADEISETLEAGRMPANDIRILSAGSPEESERPYRESSLFGRDLAEFLFGIKALLDDRPTTIELDTSDVRLTPLSEKEAVEVCFDLRGVPDEVRDYEPDIVDRETFVIEIYRVGKQWYEEAFQINPELNDLDWFQRIEQALQEAQTALEEANIDSGTEG